MNRYEEKEKRQLLDWLPEDGVFVDVGANVGFYSLFVKKHRPNLQFTCSSHTHFYFNV